MDIPKPDVYGKMSKRDQTVRPETQIKVCDQFFAHGNPCHKTDNWPEVTDLSYQGVPGVFDK